MLVHDCVPAVLVRGEHHAAVSAEVLCVFQAADQVRDASQAETEADHGSPGAVLLSQRQQHILTLFPPLHPLFFSFLFGDQKIEKTYWVVLPACFSVRVIARVWHTGQSTGADASESDCKGVTVWYTCAAP